MYWLTITCVLNEAFIGYHLIDKGLHVIVLDGLQYFKMRSMVPGGVLSCSTLPFKHDEMCLWYPGFIPFTYKVVDFPYW